MTILESVRSGISFIESNLRNNIGVSDVAGAVSYSQFYFSREFSRHTHISVYDYITRRKVSEAYKCLFGTGLKIVDLAFRYGFQSHEVFTRAFRKMFGENPSEAAVYRPLAIFEAIDVRYLDFLVGLRTALPEEPAAELFFETDGAALSEGGRSTLMQLDKENLFAVTNTFRGEATAACGRSLSFRLAGMTAKLRVYGTDEAMACRYFFDHVYDAGELGGNYILARRTGDAIDFLIPAKA